MGIHHSRVASDWDLLFRDLYVAGSKRHEMGSRKFPLENDSVDCSDAKLLDQLWVTLICHKLDQ